MRQHYKFFCALGHSGLPSRLVINPYQYRNKDIEQCNLFFKRFLLQLTEDEGFEPPHAFTRLTVFKTAPLTRLG